MPSNNVVDFCWCIDIDEFVINTDTRVAVKSLRCSGVVKYIGKIDNSSNYNPTETYYGIELKLPKGNTNGTIGDKCYFVCKSILNGFFAVRDDIMPIHGTNNNVSVNTYNISKQQKQDDNEPKFPYISLDTMSLWKREEVVLILLPYLENIDDLAKFVCSFIPHTNKIVYGSNEDEHIYDVTQKIGIFSLTKESYIASHSISVEFSSDLKRK